MSDLEDAELDQLLERFDQTEPTLQRKIVGRLMLNIAALEAQRDELAAALREYLVEVPFCGGCDSECWTRGCKCRCHELKNVAEVALAKVPKK